MDIQIFVLWLLFHLSFLQVAFLFELTLLELRGHGLACLLTLLAEFGEVLQGCLARGAALHVLNCVVPGKFQTATFALIEHAEQKMLVLFDCDIS